MTAVKQLKPIDTFYIEEQATNSFQYEGDIPQTMTEWGDYLKQFDVSLKEDLPLNIEYFDSLSKTNSISELWKDLVTEHPLSHQIQKNLASLTPIQKQIIHLSYWEGLSLRAIGKEMKMSKSNVLKQRDKAIKRLKHEISKHVSTNTNSVHKI
jgi:RNA polymerase sigma factor (sigma-70 family)